MDGIIERLFRPQKILAFASSLLVVFAERDSKKESVDRELGRLRSEAVVWDAARKLW